jgi:hypothetical protein
MSRAKKQPAQPKPVYVPPKLDRLDLRASRDFCNAAFRGDRAQPVRGDFDPLHMRMGMLAHERQARAGWVVSNPLLDQTLKRVPSLDSSLPGPGWLNEIYRKQRYAELVLLASSLVSLATRQAALSSLEYRSPARVGPDPPIAAVESVDSAQLVLFE